MPKEPGTVPGYENVVVRITPGNPPIVFPDPVYVSKKGKNEVVWECDGNQDFEVIFEGDCPFNEKRFGRGSNRSGGADRHPENTTRTYNYTVKAGGVRDPQTIVNP